ncbi:hypothetical protein D9C73_000944 [Collichthys lucidus]|uniref:Uncharacterized protein n=1 Tax=Collichthys lucidus TaxID=240159 RepID=A0A4V6AM96_COLLU|nr:hypothetical protein D9C73_000944 [Collichthys lucidus]
MKPKSEYMAMKPESDYVVMKPQHAKIPPSEEFERHGTSRTWTESDASSQPSKGGSSHVKTKPIKRSHAEEDQESDASSQPSKGGSSLVKTKPRHCWFQDVHYSYNYWYFSV